MLRMPGNQITKSLIGHCEVERYWEAFGRGTRLYDVLKINWRGGGMSKSRFIEERTVWNLCNNPSK
jgi:hypothetical protein